MEGVGLQRVEQTSVLGQQVDMWPVGCPESIQAKGFLCPTWPFAGVTGPLQESQLRGSLTAGFTLPRRDPTMVRGLRMRPQVRVNQVEGIGAVSRGGRRRVTAVMSPTLQGPPGPKGDWEQRARFHLHPKPTLPARQLWALSAGGPPAWGVVGGVATESPPSSEALRPLYGLTEAGRKPWERSNSVEKPVSSLLSR